jgi:hypothetical protein
MPQFGSSNFITLERIRCGIPIVTNCFVMFVARLSPKLFLHADVAQIAQ